MNKGVVRKTNENSKTKTILEKIRPSFLQKLKSFFKIKYLNFKNKNNKIITIINHRVI